MLKVCFRIKDLHAQYCSSLASFPGHSQIHSCKIESGSGLGTSQCQRFLWVTELLTLLENITELLPFPSLPSSLLYPFPPPFPLPSFLPPSLPPSSIPPPSPLTYIQLKFCFCSNFLARAQYLPVSHLPIYCRSGIFHVSCFRHSAVLQCNVYTLHVCLLFMLLVTLIKKIDSEFLCVQGTPNHWKFQPILIQVPDNSLTRSGSSCNISCCGYTLVLLDVQSRY